MSSVLSHQHALPSGFSAFSTADDVAQGIDLTGKNIVVTGGYSGLGLQTVRVLAAAGARIIVPARDVARAAEALKEVSGQIEYVECDLSSQVSVKGAVESILAKNIPIHILVNSAAIMALPEKNLDSRGLELQWATNHLGHFQLTVGLLPALRAAKGARVVSVSSAGHRFSPFNFDDPNFETHAYVPFTAYGQSKTANILFALELDKREQKNGIRAFSLHPGLILTNLGRHMDSSIFVKSGFIDEQGNAIIKPEEGLKTPAQGASTQVFAAISPKLSGLGGVYLEDTDVASLCEDLSSDIGRRVPGVRPYAIDDAAAERLWNLSESILAKHAQ